MCSILGPKATMKQTEHDFKNIKQGKIVDHNFTITNTGGDLLKNYQMCEHHVVVQLQIPKNQN